MSRIFKRQSRLFWKLFLGHAVLTIVALATCVFLIFREYEAFYAEELTEHLRAQAVALRSVVQGRLNASHVAELDRIAKEAGDVEIEGLRITFVATDGTVLGDSQAEPTRMDSHHDRVEVVAALTDGWGTSTRWSDTVKRTFRYVAVRVGPGENPEGVVRVALGQRTIGAKTQSVRKIIWTIAVIAIVAATVFALGLARLWTIPIRRIMATAGRISRGDLTARARISGSDELARLAQSLNDMGDHLSRQLTTIDHQRQTLEALLDQVQEGVIVAGFDGKILHANRAAARLLHPDDAEHWLGVSWAGRPIEQCVPQHELQKLLLADCTATTTPGDPGEATTPSQDMMRPGNEVRVEIPTADGPVVLLARASTISLPSPAGESKAHDSVGQPSSGRILALTDITQIARTIQMKTDFVANASHELRTPLSAIRGAVETVLNIDVQQDAAAMERFLGVINRHSARLEALVSDLLALSRLETPSNEFKLVTLDLPRFCDELQDRWADALNATQLEWVCHVPTNLREATADVHLLNLALENLIDNAIKFTPAGGRIALRLDREGSDLLVEVADNGFGIPAQDQERVFERFYQVAQDRSRAASGPTHARGTGLGLAIVRHAMAAMNGSVSLRSEVNVGTTVTLRIPQATQAELD